jgi:hypothetical protein
LLDSARFTRADLKILKDSAKKERKYNMYAHRKFSYGLSETFYGFSPNTIVYHATDVVFSDRLRHLDIGDWASFELTGGASFQPYQGFRLHAGFDYEWLTPTRVHLYIGTQYALGLKNNTLATDSRSSVMVGYHSYLVPFTGIMYWPGKRDIQRINLNDPSELAKLRHPTFWQLVFIKAQVGYSILLSDLAVHPSETFDPAAAETIRRNVSSGLYLSAGVGINLPTFGNARQKDHEAIQRLQAY